MAMEFARAFIDVHHKVKPRLYPGNDFQLVVDDGTGSPAIHPDLANNVPAWNLTATEIQNLGILMGWATRSLNFAGGVDNTITTVRSTGNLDDARGLLRIGYMIMGRDSANNDIIDPTEYIRSPSGKDQLVIDFDTNGNNSVVGGSDTGGGLGNRTMPLFGGMFCNSDGIPISPMLFGSNKQMIGISFGAKDTGRMELVTSTPKSTYPSSPDDSINNTFGTFNSNLNATGQRRRIIFDRDSASYADILEDETLTGPFSLPESAVDVLFDRNNQDINLIPALLGRQGFTFTNGDPAFDFDWDIYYRNRSDA